MVKVPSTCKQADDKGVEGVKGRGREVKVSRGVKPRQPMNIHVFTFGS